MFTWNLFPEALQLPRNSGATFTVQNFGRLFNLKQKVVSLFRATLILALCRTQQKSNESFFGNKNNFQIYECMQFWIEITKKMHIQQRNQNWNCNMFVLDFCAFVSAIKWNKYPINVSPKFSLISRGSKCSSSFLYWKHSKWMQDEDDQTSECIFYAEILYN